MGSNEPAEDERVLTSCNDANDLPRPSASYRRRAWIDFQRALDPLAPIKPLPLPPPRP